MKPLKKKTENSIQKKRRQGRQAAGILTAAVLCFAMLMTALPAAAEDGVPAPEDTAVEVQPAEAEPAPAPAEEPAPVPAEEPAPAPAEEPAPAPAEEPAPAPAEEPAPAPAEDPSAAPETPVPEDPSAVPGDSGDASAKDPASVPPEDGQTVEEPTDGSDADQKDEADKKEEEKKEEKYAASPLTYECAAYTAKLSFDAAAGLPEGTKAEIREYDAGSPEYARYLETIKNKLKEDGTGEEKPEETITSLQLYEVVLTDKDGGKIRPASAIEIEIGYKNGPAAPEGEKQYVVSFRMDDGQPMKAAFQDKNTDGSDVIKVENAFVKTLHAKSFALQDTHVHPVIGRLALAQKEDTEETGLDAEEPEAEENTEAGEPALEPVAILSETVPVAGAPYSLNLTYGSDAGVPEEAVFTAVRVTEDHAGYEAYRDAALRAAEDQTGKEPELLELFGLAVSDAEGNLTGQKIPVTVSIDLGIALDEIEDVCAVRFAGSVTASEEDNTQAAETDPEIIAAERKDGVVTFKAETDSVYAIAGTGSGAGDEPAEENTETIFVKIVNKEEMPLGGAAFRLIGPDGETQIGEVFEIPGETGGYSIPDLAAGDYSLVEVAAPKGYNLLSDTIAFHVNAGDEDGEGVITWPDNEKPENVGDLGSASKKDDTISVINTPGLILPSIGGFGTLP